MDLLKGWNWVRVFRLVVGIAALVQGILYHNNVLWMMGGLLLVQAVFNMGCCGVGGCAIPAKSQSKNQESTKPIEYEEVV